MTTESPEMARLEAHIEHVRDSIVEMKTVITDMSKAITALASVEARQVEQGNALGRAFNEIGDVEKRVSALELQQPLNKQTQGLVQKAVELVLVAVLGALLAIVVAKPSEVKAPVGYVQAAPVQKGAEVQTNGAPK